MGYQSQIGSRARDKQKMLEVLSETGLLPPGLPRSAANYPELSGELHNAIVGFLALTPSQLLAINQEDLTKGTGAAEPARDYVAVSGKEDAAERGAVTNRPASPRVHGHVRQLDREIGKKKPI